MARDKYTATWVSHSSMGDFLKCPRAYYLHNVYKDPKTGRKIDIVSSALSLGQAVHITLESLKNIPFEKRINRDLLRDFEKAWERVSGRVGGFKDNVEEFEAKERGRAMIEQVVKNPGPVSRKTVSEFLILKQVNMMREMNLFSYQFTFCFQMLCKNVRFPAHHIGILVEIMNLLVFLYLMLMKLEKRCSQSQCKLKLLERKKFITVLAAIRAVLLVGRLKPF